MQPKKEKTKELMLCDEYKKQAEQEEFEVNQAFKEWSDAEDAAYLKDMKVLEDIKSFLSEEEYEDLLVLIKESEQTFSFTIEDNPKGEYQKEDLDHLKGCHVDQYRNGGYTGDDFGGSVSVKLNNGKYFQFHYSM